ncbi:MAG: hypothetical protein JXR07_14180 [Reichenbachiella sp.]
MEKKKKNTNTTDFSLDNNIVVEDYDFPMIGFKEKKNKEREQRKSLDETRNRKIHSIKK